MPGVGACLRAMPLVLTPATSAWQRTDLPRVTLQARQPSIFAGAQAMTETARIVGKVEYREGDGQNIVIRPGRIEVQTTATDATLSWTDGDTRGSAAMPLTQYRRYLAEGAIEPVT